MLILVATANVEEYEGPWIQFDSEARGHVNLVFSVRVFSPNNAESGDDRILPCLWAGFWSFGWVSNPTPLSREFIGLVWDGYVLVAVFHQPEQGYL
jgi:hypothetical protein